MMMTVAPHDADGTAAERYPAGNRSMTSMKDSSPHYVAGRRDILRGAALLADAAHSRQAAKPNRKRYDFDF